MKLYLDMDGVLADFDLGCAKMGIQNKHNFIHKPRSEWTEEEKKLDIEVNRLMATPGFFYNLPPMDGAFALWDFCQQFNPTVLTARPKNDEIAERVIEEKTLWLREVLDCNNVIVCLRAEKQKYAKTFVKKLSGGYFEPNILVDDLQSNIDEWNAAGGVSILFKNSIQAISDLKKVYDV